MEEIKGNKKIVIITHRPPTIDNIGGPTALPFHLIKHIPEDVDVYLYYFNNWGVDGEYILKGFKDLRLARHKVIEHFLIDDSTTPVAGDFPVKEYIVDEINNLKPDAIWLYPLWLFNWIPHFDADNIVISGMDSISLHYKRSIKFGSWNGLPTLKKLVSDYTKYVGIEKEIGALPTRVHMVGEQDVVEYNWNSKNTDQAFYTPYFYFQYKDLKEDIKSAKGKLKVVITGGAKKVYLADHLDLIVEGLVQDPSLAREFEFHFLGSKYEKHLSKLEDAGYIVEKHGWVEDYDDFLSEMHIQLFPIAVGTGTKGKALQAMADGLLGIGSEFTFENIKVVPGEDCLQYHSPKEVPDMLREISQNREKYSKMALNGMDKVRNSHSPKIIAESFWPKILNPEDTYKQFRVSLKEKSIAGASWIDSLKAKITGK